MDAKEKRNEPEIDNPSIIPFNRVEEDKIKMRLLEEERKREYNQVLAKVGCFRLIMLFCIHT